MAEVTITMVDPEAYEGPIPVSRMWWWITTGLRTGTKNALRKQKAAEAEEIIASEQPGQVLDEDEARG